MKCDTSHTAIYITGNIYEGKQTQVILPTAQYDSKERVSCHFPQVRIKLPV